MIGLSGPLVRDANTRVGCGCCKPLGAASDVKGKESTVGARHAVLETLYSHAHRIGLDGGSCLLHSSSKGVSLRSEEHTSELQSHHDLVCRLLLEKKNQYKRNVRAAFLLCRFRIARALSSRDLELSRRASQQPDRTVRRTGVVPGGVRMHSGRPAAV